MWWLWMSVALADFPGRNVVDGVVLGANVTVALGPTEGARVGGGIDAGLRRLHYSRGEAPFRGDMAYWSVEHPTLDYGVGAHVWTVRGTWYAGLGARCGLTWPLRVGSYGGWWPGPELAAELGPVIGNSGLIGIDVQGIAEAPWAQARVGATFDGAFRDPRLHLGGFALTEAPHIYDSPRSFWSDPTR